jgi:hypothetical protein
MSSKQAASSRTRYQAFERRYSARSVIPPTAYGTRRFQVLAFPALLSCFTELIVELEQAGIRAMLYSDADAQQEIRICLSKFEASVSVRPSPDHPFLQATAQAGRSAPSPPGLVHPVSFSRIGGH